MFHLSSFPVTGTTQTDVVTNQMWDAEPVKSFDTNNIGETFARTAVETLFTTKQSAKM